VKSLAGGAGFGVQPDATPRNRMQRHATASAPWKNEPTAGVFAIASLADVALQRR